MPVSQLDAQHLNLAVENVHLVESSVSGCTRGGQVILQPHQVLFLHGQTGLELVVLVTQILHHVTQAAHFPFLQQQMLSLLLVFNDFNAEEAEWSQIC